MIETKYKPRPQKRSLKCILFFLYSDSILGEEDKLFIANRSTHYVLITWKQKHHFTIFILFFHKVLPIKSCIGPFLIHQILGSCVFLGLTKIRRNQTTALRSLVDQNAWVKEFLHMSSENCISWIFGLFFENAHKWKTHHWNPQEPRTRCKTESEIWAGLH